MSKLNIKFLDQKRFPLAQNLYKLGLYEGKPQDAQKYFSITDDSSSNPRYESVINSLYDYIIDKNTLTSLSSVKLTTNV